VIFSYSERWYLNVKQGHAESPCFNAFVVMVGAGQYAPQNLLPEEIDGRPTGIAGPVPRYDVKQRRWEEVPKEDVVKYALDATRTQYYLAEINVSPVEHVSLPPGPAL